MTTTILPAPPLACTVTGCTGDPRSHSGSEAPAHHIHEMPSLDAHSFVIDPMREGDGPWRAFVDLGHADIHDAGYLHRLAAAAAAEAERLDLLNGIAPAESEPECL